MLNDEIRSVAFRHLLRTHQPVTVESLADQLGESSERVEAAIAQMDRRGEIRRNPSGAVVGSIGLNVEPSRHELFIDEQKFWTWCAYDAVGILAALGASGRVRTKSPLTGSPIDLAFRDGSPESSEAALFLPDSITPAAGSTSSGDTGLSVFDNWCPLANLFENQAAGRTWAERHHARGRILSLTDAVARGAANWGPVVGRV